MRTFPPLSKERDAASIYRLSARIASRRTSPIRERYVSPTSATNTTTRAPVNRSTPEPRSGYCGDRLRLVSKAKRLEVWQSTAPDCLAAIQPQVEKRLTSLSSFGRFTRIPPTHVEETRAAFRRRCPIAAYSAEKGAGEGTSDALCHPRAPARGTGRTHAESQDRFHRSHVNESDFPRPRAPSIDKCSFYAPACADRNPPPYTPHYRHVHGFRRSFVPWMLSHGGTRPDAIAQAHRLWSRGSHAACRLLQSMRSASTTRAIDRALHAAPGVTPKAASLQVAPPFRSAASRGFRGQGPAYQSGYRHPSAAIARCGSLSPT